MAHLTFNILKRKYISKEYTKQYINLLPHWTPLNILKRKYIYLRTCQTGSTFTQEYNKQYNDNWTHYTVNIFTLNYTGSTCTFEYIIQALHLILNRLKWMYIYLEPHQTNSTFTFAHTEQNTLPRTH